MFQLKDNTKPVSFQQPYAAYLVVIKFSVLSVSIQFSGDFKSNIHTHKNLSVPRIYPKKLCLIVEDCLKTKNKN